MASKAVSSIRPLRAALPLLFTILFFSAAILEMYDENTSIAFTLILFFSSLINALSVKTRVRKIWVTLIMLINGCVFLLLAGKYFDTTHTILFYAWLIGLVLAISRGLYGFSKYQEHNQKKKSHSSST